MNYIRKIKSQQINISEKRNYKMNELAKLNNEFLTMSSLEIVDVINSLREPEDAVMLHKNFLAKVLRVLGEDLAANFLAVRIDSRGKEQPCYNLPKREAHLMVMSENYKVQAAIYDKWQELEQERMLNKVLPNFSDPIEACEAWLKIQKEHKALKDNNVMFPKKVLVDKEKITLSDIKTLYPFLQIKHIQIILNYYSTEKVKLKNNHFFVKEQVEDYMTQFISTVESEVVSEKNILLSHECLFDIKLYVKKKYAIEYFGYFEENFEV